MGKYISGVIIISKTLGISLLFSINLSIPDPSETPINNCGVNPIKDPKK